MLQRRWFVNGSTLDIRIKDRVLAALVGGDPRARPGEIALAHKGVLFSDELPVFSRPALEALRQPLETGRVAVARALRHITYPAVSADCSDEPMKFCCTLARTFRSGTT